MVTRIEGFDDRQEFPMSVQSVVQSALPLEQSSQMEKKNHQQVLEIRFSSMRQLTSPTGTATSSEQFADFEHNQEILDSQAQREFWTEKVEFSLPRH